MYDAAAAIVPINTVDTVRDLPDDSERQQALIDSLTTRIGEHGYLSTLLWDTRNRYLGIEGATFGAAEVRTLVEAFLTEIEFRSRVQPTASGQ